MIWLVPFYALSILSNTSDRLSEEKSLSTSVAGMEQLLKTEIQLLTALENYAMELEKKAAVIDSSNAVMLAENLKSLEDPEEYLSNPLHSFALIRRMHMDWVYWELFMQNPVGEEQIAEVQKLQTVLPTSTDMDEATNAFFRLQTTYDLKAEDMASGLLNGKQYNSSLTSRDCFELGRREVEEENVVHSLYWLNSALQRYEEYEINAVMNFNALTILDALTESFLKHDMLSNAMSAIEIALLVDPHNAKYLREKLRIEKALLTSKLEPKQFIQPDIWTYFNCCRGDFDNRPSRLHCRYNTTTHPFLKLAPLKMEEIYLDPYIVVYYDVLNDAEIAEIKKLSLPHLKRNTVYFPETQRRVPIKDRTSQACFIEDTTNELTRRIAQRVGDMSGFDMNCTDRLHVINYGLGGHYMPHFDAYNVSMNVPVVRELGDRLATLMFYLSDVEQGGATVFPSLETTVYPRKGSALLWYNLDNRGIGNLASLHGACPVLYGSKWVMTKWIHEREQLFRRPCFKE